MKIAYQKWLPAEDMPLKIDGVFTVDIKDDIEGLRIMLELQNYPKILKITFNTDIMKLPYRAYEEELALLRDNPFGDTSWRYFYKLDKSDFISEFYDVCGDDLKVEHYIIFTSDYNFEFLSFADTPPKVEWLIKGI